MACRGARRTSPHLDQPHRHQQIQRRALPRTRARDGASGRVEAGGQPHPRAVGGADDPAEAHDGDGRMVRHRIPPDLAGRGQGEMAADEGRRHPRRRVAAARREGAAQGSRHRLGQRRAGRRCDPRRRRPRHRHPSSGRTRHRRRDRPGHDHRGDRGAHRRHVGARPRAPLRRRPALVSGRTPLRGERSGPGRLRRAAGRARSRPVPVFPRRRRFGDARRVPGRIEAVDGRPRAGHVLVPVAGAGLGEIRGTAAPR